MSKNIYVKDGYLTLDYGYPYDIELSRLDTPEKILRWVEQLSAKNWVTDSIIGAFVLLALDQINLPYGRL